MEKKFLVVVRHGRDNGDALSDEGIRQVRNLRQIIWDHVAAIFGENKVVPLYFCFSDFKRALQTAQKLSSGYCGDIVITNLYLTLRGEIRKPRAILEKVLKIADCYCAQVVVVVAHGEMPAVLAETAHEFVTGEKLLKELPPTSQACGHIVDLSTGKITDICFDSLDEKPAQSVAQKEVQLVSGLRTEGLAKMAAQKFGPPKVSSFDALERAISEDDSIPF